MTAIFAAFGNMPEFFRQAIRCAEARAGMPVKVLTEVPPHLAHARDMLLKMTGADRGRGTMLAYALLRWLVILDYVERERVEFPIFTLDWDVLVLADLKPMAERWRGHDYCACNDCHGQQGVAQLIYDVAPLKAFADSLNSVIEKYSPSPEYDHLHDMLLWRDMLGVPFKIGIISEPRDGEVFEHSVGDDAGRFTMCDGHKTLICRHGFIYFEDRNTGALVKAVNVHLWGGFKDLAPQIMKACGIA